MKKLEKQSMKELIKYALEMPVGDLQKYGTLFLSGPVPESMTRGELIALQLLERASFGDLEAVKEIRQWILEDPKSAAPAAGTNYYQFLIQMAGAEAPGAFPAEAAQGLRKMAQAIEVKVKAVQENTTPVDLLEDLT